MRPSQSSESPPQGDWSRDGTLEMVFASFFRAGVRLNRPLLSLLLLLQVFASSGFCASVEDGTRLDVASNIYFDFEDRSITDTNLANELIRQARQSAEGKNVAEALQLATKALVADPNRYSAVEGLGRDVLTIFAVGPNDVADNYNAVLRDITDALGYHVQDRP